MVITFLIRIGSNWPSKSGITFIKLQEDRVAVVYVKGKDIIGGHIKRRQNVLYILIWNNSCFLKSPFILVFVN